MTSLLAMQNETCLGFKQQELSEANHKARRSAGEKLNISPLDIGHK